MNNKNFFLDRLENYSYRPNEEEIDPIMEYINLIVEEIVNKEVGLKYSGNESPISGEVHSIWVRNKNKILTSQEKEEIEEHKRKIKENIEKIQIFFNKQIFF